MTLVSGRTPCSHPDVRYCPEEKGAVACFVCGRLFGHLREGGVFIAYNFSPVGEHCPRVEPGLDDVLPQLGRHPVQRPDDRLSVPADGGDGLPRVADARQVDPPASQARLIRQRTGAPDLVDHEEPSVHASQRMPLIDCQQPPGCHCTNTCEFPCWQRAGLTTLPCCPTCKPPISEGAQNRA